MNKAVWVLGRFRHVELQVAISKSFGECFYQQDFKTLQPFLHFFRLHVVRIGGG
jgi:hypothetical protein